MEITIRIDDSISIEIEHCSVWNTLFVEKVKDGEITDIIRLEKDEADIIISNFFSSSSENINSLFQNQGSKIRIAKDCDSTAIIQHSDFVSIPVQFSDQFIEALKTLRLRMR